MNLYAAHYRRPFAFCYFLYPLHRGRCLRFGCLRVLSDAQAMHGVYLVSQRVHPAGKPGDGVRDVLSAARVGEPTAVHDKQWPTWCLLATAPQFSPRDKRKLIYSYDGSIERSHAFPIPFTSAFFDRLVQSIGRALQSACAHEACGLCAECLTVAPHPAITRDARTVEVTSFRKWFQLSRNKTRWMVSRYQFG